MMETATSPGTVLPPTLEGPAKAGPLFFGAALAGTGLQHLVARDFVTRMFRMEPGAQPGRALVACLLGLFLLGLGAALAAGKRTRTGALSGDSLLWGYPRRTGFWL